ncbi:hypothetical protein NDU88_001591 [Pleurodeles waltl]|uniref:Uncharacterized protein n=1 Tax=Pleurodeles waltl TaxID=8319 RepID=A0AAV7UT61_PLEWA|nr:hypothetical protein NDU88_001591 [Pleurodeles waltl]
MDIPELAWTFHQTEAFQQGCNAEVQVAVDALQQILDAQDAINTISPITTLAVPMEAYLDHVGPLKVEPFAKKKSQKRKSKATGEGPFAKKGKPLRNRTETAQENSDGDWRKRKRTVTPLEDIKKLQKCLGTG